MQECMLVSNTQQRMASFAAFTICKDHCIFAGCLQQDVAWMRLPISRRQATEAPSEGAIITALSKLADLIAL